MSIAAEPLSPLSGPFPGRSFDFRPPISNLTIYIDAILPPFPPSRETHTIHASHHRAACEFFCSRFPFPLDMMKVTFGFRVRDTSSDAAREPQVLLPPSARRFLFVLFPFHSSSVPPGTDFGRPFHENPSPMSDRREETPASDVNHSRKPASREST